MAAVEPVLLPHELESSVWKKLKASLEVELADRREYNDGQSLNEVQTALIRGEIKHIKRMLKLGTPKQDKQAGA